MTTPATSFLEQESRGMLTRLDGIRPFALNETTVLAAALPPRAQAAIEQFVLEGRRALRRRVVSYLEWLCGSGAGVPPDEQQRGFAVLRLAFNDVLSQFDLFAEVITQRSEHGTGVWLSGLDMLAADALRLRRPYLDPPPVVCYLARGPGAAIRRARTRLPGGRSNPVAIIRVPRERMVGHGIASSVIHEVGHQGAALLSLVEALRPVLLQASVAAPPEDQPAWQSWQRWISEIVADLWSVARLGVGSTVGLVGVVSLPRWFVFRPSGEDPHPIPWIRVRLSAAIGAALYPHPQWQQLTNLWSTLYPLATAPAGMQQTLRRLDATIPEFVDVLLSHQPPSLRGARIGAALRSPNRRPEALTARFEAWRAAPDRIARTPPALAFAVVGQARAAGRITPEQESRLLGDLLTSWAVRSSVDTSLICALAESRALAPAS
jgi:hypothetical protein